MTLFIAWIWGYLVPWVSGFLIFGIALMMADMYLVKNETRRWFPAYRKWYNRSRKPEDHLPLGTMGWFYGQTLPRWHNRALFISLVHSVIAVAFLGANALFEFIAFLVEAWAVLPGLWLGKYAFNLLWKQDEYIKKVEEIREKVTATNIAGIGASIAETVSKTVARAAAAAAPETHEPATPVPPKAVPKSEDMSAASILQRKQEGRKV